jgi:phenylalanine ammonia-lyase
MMCAAYLTMVCQALDLRVLQRRFLEILRPIVFEKITTILDSTLVETGDPESSGQAIFVAVVKTWNASTTLDLVERCDKTAEAASALLFSEISDCKAEFKCSTQELFSGIKTWRGELSLAMKENYEQAREEMFQHHIDITPQRLGQGSKKLYLFVRKDLKVPFHRGLVEEPTHVLAENQQASFPTGERRTIGSLISIVYEALRNGSIRNPLINAVKDNMK